MNKKRRLLIRINLACCATQHAKRATAASAQCAGKNAQLVSETMARFATSLMGTKTLMKTNNANLDTTH